MIDETNKMINKRKQIIKLSKQIKAKVRVITRLQERVELYGTIAGNLQDTYFCNGDVERPLSDNALRISLSNLEQEDLEFYDTLESYSHGLPWIQQCKNRRLTREEFEKRIPLSIKTIEELLDSIKEQRRDSYHAELVEKFTPYLAWAKEVLAEHLATPYVNQEGKIK